MNDKDKFLLYTANDGAAKVEVLYNMTFGQIKFSTILNETTSKIKGNFKPCLVI